MRSLLLLHPWTCRLKCEWPPVLVLMRQTEASSSRSLIPEPSELQSRELYTDAAWA